MKQINFKEFELATDVSQKEFVRTDAREPFANMLYSRVPGLASHALAMKIYASDGVITIDDKEEEVLNGITAELITPMFIDGLKRNLVESES